MDRVLKVRQPPEQSQVALSRASKIFFGCDIFQVIAVVVFQSSMIALGDFSAYNNVEHPGMGPGRRIYMTIYMGAVVYTCFLCLFAVKRQNFMEIVAFDLQNFGFVTYSFIQLYHVGFKTYNGLKTSENDALPKIVIANATTLLLLSIVFTYLSYKLNMEFGWKIYKRVRFNIKLRGIYQIYELLSCLLKIEVLYWGMFAIVHSLVLLRDTHNMLFFLSLAFIPLSFLYAGLGYYATRLENKWLMTFFLSWTVAGIGYFLYKLYGFITRTCSGCKEFEKNGKDIPSEAFMHFVYLVVINLLVAITIFGVALKAFLNFGGGLAEHFNRKKKPQLKLPGRYDLSLGQGSHSYPEESVISVTSYEYDEFGESVTLERSLLNPAVAALLSDNGQHLEDKRSCSLPNLLIETPERSSTFGGLGQASAPVLSGWLEAQDRKQNSAPCEVTSVSQEKPNGKCTRDTNSMEEKQVCDDKIHLEGIANADGAPFSPCTITAKSPGLGDATHNCPLNGYVTKKSDHSEGNFYREVPLASELKLNGHLVGKARLKCTPETEVEKSCLLQGVNSTKCSCGDDEQCSEQFASRGMCHGNPLLLQNQRPAQLNGASTSDDEVFDRYT